MPHGELPPSDAVYLDGPVMVHVGPGQVQQMIWVILVQVAARGCGARGQTPLEEIFSDLLHLLLALFRLPLHSPQKFHQEAVAVSILIAWLSPHHQLRVNCIVLQAVSLVSVL